MDQMDLKQRAIDALAVDGQVPGMDLYAALPPSVATPTRVHGYPQPPSQVPMDPQIAVDPATGTAYYMGAYQGQAPTAPAAPQDPVGAVLGVGAGSGAGSATETIPQRFRKASGMVESRFAWQRRWRYFGFAREALPWAGAALLIACMIMVVTRPSFVYARADEFTAPQFSLQRLAILSLIVGVLTFGLVVYGMATSLM